jgi:cell division protein FtsQ
MNINICTIKNIELVDNNLVTKEQIEELANFDQYTNLFSLNITKVKEDIKKNAYIEDVKVSKKFPNTVKITLEERVPKYMLQVADSYIYINNQGYMLDISVEKLDLPIILGFKTDLSNVSAGSRLDVDDLKQMQTIIKIVETANINDIGSYITKIDVSNTKNYTLILEGEQKTVYLGDCSDLNTRMLYLSGILNQTKNLAGEIFLNMDLNTEDAYFREQT